MLYLETSEKVIKSKNNKPAKPNGDAAIKIYNTFTYGENEDKGDLLDLTRKFDEYSQPRSTDLSSFLEHKNKENRWINVTELKTLAATCDFED